MKRLAKNWLEILTCLCLSTLVVTVFLQVLFRFVIKLPAPWTEEVTRIAFVYMVFLGAGLGVKYQRHLTVDVLGAVPANLRKWIVSIGYVLSIAFVGVLIYYGAKHTVNSKLATTPTLELSLSYLYMIIPISGLIMLYYLLKNMIAEIRNREVN
ncbi:TRAP transporter small permease [Brevibacillus massiliensis]|jgi:TRAP-type C4-dicarboxylate transport system permease small subunit|uniref:TRAP transporter small permease n=1 Tax=Brevibacillus massiliensis TaxID=1118054 RepID=UPI0002EB5D43|nr:TRAP transporter small permease [Brevibacillus massiliensis]